MAVELTVNDTLISHIARDIARNLYPLGTIRENYKLSQDNFDAILGTQMFKQRLEEELAIWNASDAMSITKRIQAKAATVVEESLAEVYTLVHDRSQPMAAKVEALKWASRMAGADQNPNVRPGTGDEKVVFNIVIGDKRMTFDKERVLPSKVIDGEAVVLTPDAAS